MTSRREVGKRRVSRTTCPIVNADPPKVVGVRGIVDGRGALMRNALTSLQTRGASAVEMVRRIRAFDPAKCLLGQGGVSAFNRHHSLLWSANTCRDVFADGNHLPDKQSYRTGMRRQPRLRSANSRGVAVLIESQLARFPWLCRLGLLVISPFWK